MQRRLFDTPLGRIFLVEGIFPFELTSVLTPFPKNSFGWEYKPRSSLCSDTFHRTDSKDPDIHVLDSNKNTPSMHHPWRWNVTTSMVGLKTVTYAYISPKMVNPRDIAGECRRRRRRRKPSIKTSQSNKPALTSKFFCNQDNYFLNFLPMLLWLLSVFCTCGENPHILGLTTWQHAISERDISMMKDTLVPASC